MIKKIRSTNGESIAETLVALLIAALGFLVLAGAISSTLNIINTSNKAMADYVAAQKSIVSKNNSEATSDVVTADGNISITSQNNLSNKQFNVTVYINRALSNRDVVSFEKRN